jgi:hypothetical protein
MADNIKIGVIEGGDSKEIVPLSEANKKLIDPKDLKKGKL